MNAAEQITTTRSHDNTNRLSYTTFRKIKEVNGILELILLILLFMGFVILIGSDGSALPCKKTSKRRLEDQATPPDYRIHSSGLQPTSKQDIILIAPCPTIINIDQIRLQSALFMPQCGLDAV